MLQISFLQQMLAFKLQSLSLSVRLRAQVAFIGCLHAPNIKLSGTRRVRRG